MTDKIVKTKIDGKLDAESDYEIKKAVSIMEAAISIAEDERATIEEVEFEVRNGFFILYMVLKDDKSFKTAAHHEVIVELMEQFHDHPSDGCKLDHATNVIEVEEESEE